VAVAYAKPGKGLVKLNGEPLIGWYSGVVSSSKQQPATVNRACVRQGDAKVAQQAEGPNTGLIHNRAGRQQQQQAGTAAAGGSSSDAMQEQHSYNNRAASRSVISNQRGSNRWTRCTAVSSAAQLSCTEEQNSSNTCAAFVQPRIS
jgi:hypothetical protein